MAKKYYAVRNGYKIGVFDSWAEAEKSVRGYPNAAYKGFPTMKEAEQFLNAEKNIQKDATIIANSVDVYVDGSFSENKKMYSYGIVLLKEDTIIDKMSGVGKNTELLTMRNVAGELEGAMQAISWAVSNNFDRIVIHYDYIGIEKWATGEWKANKTGTKSYKSFIQKFKNLISIEFVKVKAHSGVAYNEMVDKLAGEAIDNYSDVQTSNFSNSIEKNSLDNPKISSQKYDEQFKKVISKAGNDKGKNSVIIELDDLKLSNSQIDQFVKAVWKEEKKLVKDISYYNATVNVDKRSLKWDVYDVLGKQFSFEFWF